ncbi:cocaine- and amphetamine-regulated transcript protein-like [Gouania willdenowi]|uniref:cocaine- and amphetamine-regulated transcript protein-like n=1 Tax=Gouania willdenowi TaxID=441366 RepID=UPI001054A176|nr:cocaine- and amphetamine-regulated transcript protein-like [Gouania willdenowi]
MLLVLLLLLSSLSVHSHGQMPQHASVEDFEDQREEPEPAEVQDLMEALQALTMHREVSAERRAIIPMCAIGHKCAMKFGPRIGKLCDCGRAAHCNSYLLKCI